MKPIVIILGLAAGVTGLVYLGTKKNEAKQTAVNDALDLGLDDESACEIDANDVEEFGIAKSYNVYYFTAVDSGSGSWLSKPPKPDFLANPNARAFSDSMCKFVRWNPTLSLWVSDEPTHAEYLAWTEGVAA